MWERQKWKESSAVGVQKVIKQKEKRRKREAESKGRTSEVEMCTKLAKKNCKEDHREKCQGMQNKESEKISKNLIELNGKLSDARLWA